VLAAVSELDIDLSERSKTKALAFLLSNRPMQHAFHSNILLGAEAHCASRGWELIFQSSNYPLQASGRELQLPTIAKRHGIVQGVILAGTNSPDLLKLLKSKGTSFVVLGNNIVGDTNLSGYDVVFSDDIQGGLDATRYLLGLGHRHICFVGNLRLPWFARCHEGYRRGMEEAGLTPRSSSVDSEDETEIGYLGTKLLLAKEKPVTAIFAGNDPTAHGVYRGIRDSGLEIPDDISVVGCDDTVGSWLYPALTTIREFPEQLGKQMVELLVNRIGNPSQQHQRVTVPTELIKRDSCRPITDSAVVPAKPALHDAIVS
jgi:DNA-binding LacI/PurR family transcriptional regulator